jgi:pimeloyl-ACP methyl ester carboxylesterase
VSFIFSSAWLPVLMIGMARLRVIGNLIRVDPYLVPRNLLYGLHPRAMLLTTAHVRRVFFSRQYPDDKLEDFTRYFSESDSMVGLIGMIPKFVDFQTVVQRGIVWLAGGKPDGERILIIVGEHDVLMDVPLMHQLAKRYRDAVRGSMGEEQVDRVSCAVGYEAGLEEAYTENREDGVRMVVVKGAGHYVQNDLQWEVGAQRVADFLQQL